MSKKITEAFNNLLTAVEEETRVKFEQLEARMKEKRIAQLEKDLAELNARKAKETP